MTILWLTAAVVLLIIEVLTQMMWALCLTAGALAAMICSLLGVQELHWQITAMAATALGTYVAVLPYILRRNRVRHRENTATGMDALIGRHAFVTEEIRPDKTGRIRIDGDNWQAKAPGHHDIIHAGTEVVVHSYDSIILSVKPLRR